MKKSFGIILSAIPLLFMSSLPTFGQMGQGDAYGFINMGYEYKFFNKDLIGYSEPQYESWSHGEMELSVELYTKFLYLDFDLSVLPDYLMSLSKSSKISTDRDADFLPIRLAFGSTINETLGLYAGVQYRFSSLGEIEESDLETGSATVGGHYRGFGGHAVYYRDNLILRYSFLYDWVSRGNDFGSVGLYNGTGTTHEAKAIYLLGEQIGIYLKGTFSNTVMDATPIARSIDGQAMYFVIGGSFKL